MRAGRVNGRPRSSEEAGENGWRADLGRVGDRWGESVGEVVELESDRSPL